MIQCSGGDVLLIFDEIKGKIISLRHGSAEYISAPTAVLEMSLRTPGGDSVKFSSDGLSCIGVRKSEGAFFVTYKNDVIKAVIGAEISDEIVWTLKIEVASEYTAEWANYPCIAVPNTLSKEKGGHKLIWGYNEGVLLDNLEDRERTYAYVEPEYPSNGLAGIYPGAVETQFMAYFNGEDGLYFAAHDKEDCMKGIDFYRAESGGIFLQFRHLCGSDFGETYEMPYPMVMKFFEGGWQSAADIYKEWFEKTHDWTPISDDKALPEWYHRSLVVITYPVRGGFDTDSMEPNKLFPYINVLPHVKRLEQELQSKVLVLLMHWEGTAPWAPPIVWPPFGGEEALSELVDALHERDDVIGLYCSGIGWTLNSRLDNYSTKEYYEKHHIEKEVCMPPKGGVPTSRICTGQREGYDLCPSRQFTADIMCDQVEKMAGAGVDYIQLLDQNHGGTPYFCYSREHGHPPVPGKWEVDAMKNLLERVKKTAPDTLFGCESAAAESYIPYLKFSDNRFNLNYLLGRQIPLYAYIFHKYVNNFMGNQVFTQGIIKHEKSPFNILERVAYAFTAGDFITLVLNENGEIMWNWGANPKDGTPPQQPVKTLVRNLNYWRKNYGKYLHTGDMCKNFEVLCDENIIERNFVEKTERPKIHTSAWRAQDGRFGQFLVNYNEEETPCTVCLSDKSFALTPQNGEKLAVSGRIDVKIPPLSAVLIEGDDNA